MFVRHPPTDASASGAHDDRFSAAVHGQDHADPGTAMTRALQIFLIEDSAEIREALTQTLESSGNMVVSGYADTAADAIAALDREPVDAVVVDLHLREGSGLQVLAHLAEAGNPRHILRVVLTNHNAPMFRRATEKLGAEYFLDKSMEFERAVEILAGHAAALK
jgi:DNA-binding NarL/FixJ family response regulator